MTRTRTVLSLIACIVLAVAIACAAWPVTAIADDALQSEVSDVVSDVDMAGADGADGSSLEALEPDALDDLPDDAAADDCDSPLFYETAVEEHEYECADSTIGSDPFEAELSETPGMPETDQDPADDDAASVADGTAPVPAEFAPIDPSPEPDAPEGTAEELAAADDHADSPEPAPADVPDASDAENTEGDCQSSDDPAFPDESLAQDASPVQVDEQEGSLVELIEGPCCERPDDPATIDAQGVSDEAADQVIEPTDDVAPTTSSSDEGSSEAPVTHKRPTSEAPNGSTAAPAVDEQDAALLAAPAKAPATKTGWVTEDGVKRYYDKNGKRASGLTQINGKWYFFRESDGAMAQKKFVYVPSKKQTFYFGSNGTMTYGEKRLYGFDYSFDGKTGARANAKFVQKEGDTYYYDKLGHKAYGDRYIDKQWYRFDQKTGVKWTAEKIISEVEKQARTVLGTTDGTPFENALLAAGGNLCWGMRYEWCATYIWWSFNKSGLSKFLADGWVMSEPQQYYEFYKQRGKTHWADGRFGQSIKGVKRGDLVFLDYEVMDQLGVYDDITHLAFCIGTDDKGYYTIEGNVPSAKIYYREYVHWNNRGYASMTY